MEQQLSAGLGEGEISELIEDDQVAPAQLIGGAPLVAGSLPTGLSTQPYWQC